MQAVGAQYLFLINDNKAYNLYKGTLFANLPTNLNNQVYDNISPITAVGSMGLCWNLRTKSIFCIDNGNFTN